MSTTIKTKKQLLELLRARINYDFTQKQLAAELSVSESYLSDLLADKIGLGPKILQTLGYIEVYQQKKDRK